MAAGSICTAGVSEERRDREFSQSLICDAASAGWAWIITAGTNGTSKGAITQQSCTLGCWSCDQLKVRTVSPSAEL